MQNCIQCGKEFHRNRTWQKFCNANCRKDFWDRNKCNKCGEQRECPACGAEKVVSMT